MGTKNNPGDFDCYNKADPDEPMFILLGRDRHAPELVERWAYMREFEGEDSDKVEEARVCAKEMREWRQSLQIGDPWQPILSLPLDKWVLLRGPSGYTGISYRVHVGRKTESFDPVGSSSIRYRTHSNNDFEEDGPPPTHWMPLP